MNIALVKSHFWAWFERANPEFLQFHKRSNGELKYLINELSVHLRAYCKKLGYQVSYNPQNRKGILIITAMGNDIYFKHADKLVAKAPDIPEWDIYSLYPPQAPDFLIRERFAHTGIDPERLWFRSTGFVDEMNRPDIIVYSEIYNAEKSGYDFEVAVQQVVVNILGERSAVEDIGDISIGNAIKARAKVKLEPLLQLPGFLQHCHYSALEVDKAGQLKKHSK